MVIMVMVMHLVIGFLQSCPWYWSWSSYMVMVMVMLLVLFLVLVIGILHT